MFKRLLSTLPVAAALVALLVPSAPLAAQEPDSARIAELERRIEAVTRELERMQLGGDVVQADTSVGGLPYGASKVYQIRQGVSIGGYGELLYENYADELESGAAASRNDQFDALRAILYVGYKFNDKVLFNSEIEVEHADEIYLEFAYVDYQINESLGLRGGMLLAPMGLVNELHEPTFFLSTERSLTENRIIPTTWRENGFGLFGDLGPFEWRAYMMNSLDGAGFSGSGLRGGRQKGARAVAEDFSFVGRVDYTETPGLILGASAHVGQTAMNRELDGREVDGGVFIWDLHADWRVSGWTLRGLVAGAEVNEPIALNELNGLSGSDGIGESMLGWYVEGSYDVLRGVDTGQQLTPYLRYEQLNTQRTVAEGFTADPANDITVTELGVAWKPVPQVVWKLGWQNHSNAADTGLDHSALLPRPALRAGRPPRADRLPRARDR